MTFFRIPFRPPFEARDLQGRGMLQPKLLLFVLVLAVLSLASCAKTCRCYTYYGNVDEFDLDQLEAEGTSCVEMENVDFGTTYSLCEKVIF